MKKKSNLDLTDFYYYAEQIFVSLVTSLFENPVRSVVDELNIRHQNVQKLTSVCPEDLIDTP